MFRNYLKIALRNIWKDKIYALLNTVGLAVSMAVCLIIFLNVNFETSYDRFHEEAEQIYRVTTKNEKNGVITYHDAMSFNTVGPALEKDFPEVEGYARAFKLFQGLTLRREAEVFTEEEALVVDPSFLQLFNYPLMAGDAGAVLSEPYTMVLTRSAARQYFGDESPVGKTLEVPEGQYQGAYRITGILEDVPENTHLGFDMLISYSTQWSVGIEPNWNAFNDYTYVKLSEGADVAALNAAMPEWSKDYMGEEAPLTFELQPVVDIHLHSNLAYEAGANGSSRTVYFLSLIGIFILIIAWINYVNLSTARAVNRAKEVGIRKTVGATRGILIRQFLTEAALVNFFSALIAVALVQLALPRFNDYFGQSLAIPTFPGTGSILNFWVLLALFFLLGSLASGLYPAFVLSGYRPVNVLKGKLRDSAQGIFLRKGLVVSQFAISTSLIIGVLIVDRQLNFMTNQEMGMELDQVMVLKNRNIGGELETEQARTRTFLHEVQQLQGVTRASTSMTVPATASSEIGSSSGGMWREGHVNEEERLTYYVTRVDEQFFDTYGIEVLAGRSFSEQMRTDTGRVVVLNESAMRQLGFNGPEQAAGSRIVATTANGRQKYEVLGVIRNFSRQSLKNEIEPTIYYNINEDPGLYFSLKLNTRDLDRTIGELQSLWTQTFPGRPFEFHFANDRFDRLYRSDRQFGSLFRLFALLAIGIACIGVYGLSAFTLYQRSKEIGIRKVLGASIQHIVLLFSQDFLKLVVIGFIIASPAIYFVMNSWLKGYAFRIDIPWWVFPAAMLVTLVIVIGTISLQTYRAATVNPVDALRDE